MRKTVRFGWGRIVTRIFAGWAIAAMFFAAATAATAQERPAERADRPKVCVVLSGGGARGGVHIGVLHALEDLHVPIDCIAGVSMGSAIAGFYASGMSVQELEDFINGIDWGAVFAYTPPRRLGSFRRKSEDELFLVEQHLSLSEGQVRIPLGALQGQAVDMILTRRALPVAGVRDFDELMIPYRTVATDIVTGEPVVFASGELSEVMRASMAVPVVMAPVEIGEHRLIDGGVSMNLPVALAQSMGADRIIAVDASDRLLREDQLESAVDMTLQLTAFLTKAGTDRQIALLGDDDLLLVPDLEDEITPFSFDRMAETIEEGYVMAMQNRQALETFALDERSYAEYRASLVDPRETELPVVDVVEIANDSRLADSIIADVVAEDIVPGQQLDVDGLESAITKNYASERYQNVDYALIENDGRDGVEIRLTPKTWDSSYMQVGVNYLSSSGDDSLFGVGVSYLQRDFNAHGGESRAALFVGDEPRAFVDLYQPLGNVGRFFVAPALGYESRLLNLYDGNAIETQLRLREVTLEFGGGRELGYWGEVRGGIRSGVGESRLRIGQTNPLGDDDYRRGELFARFSVDTFDDLSFPRTGVLAATEWRGSRRGILSADDDFDQLRLDASHARTWGKYTLRSRFRYDTTISGRAPVDRAYQIGGLFGLSGLHRDQLTGQHVARVGASIYRKIGSRDLFPSFAGFSLEFGNAWDSRSAISANSAVLGGSFWVGMDTPIGPVHFGYGMAEGGDDAVYLAIGRLP